MSNLCHCHIHVLPESDGSHSARPIRAEPTPAPKAHGWFVLRTQSSCPQAGVIAHMPPQALAAFSALFAGVCN